MATTPPYTNSYKQDAINSGWTDNGDGTLTGPDGSIMRPDDSAEANAKYASQNNSAAAALAGTKGSTDPYAMSNFEKQNDPNFKGDFGEATKDFYQNPDTGAFENKPEGFLSKYGPWLALAAAGGFMAAPYVAGAFGGGGASAAGAGAGTEGASSVGVGPLASGLTGAATDGVVPTSLMEGSILPSTAIGTGSIPGIVGGTGVADTAGGGLGQTLLNRLTSKSALDTIGNAAGSVGQTLANNRGSQLHGQLDIDKLQQNQEQIQMAQEKDALKKLAQTSYLQSGGNPYHPATIPGLGTLPDFGFGPKAPSAAQVQGAGTLQQTLLNRLAHPDSIDTKALSNLTTPSTGEKISDWVAPTAKIASMIPWGSIF